MPGGRRVPRAESGSARPAEEASHGTSLNDRYSTEVHMQGYDAKLVMLDGTRRNGAGSNESQDPPAGGGGDLDDDIPF